MPTSRRLLPIALLLAAALPGIAAADCAGAAPGGMIVRLDNDVWGGAHQDQGYTAGANLAWYSATGDLGEDPCLPAGARLAAQALPWLAGEGRVGNVAFAINKCLYTPVDKTRTDLIPEDRPYAGITSFAVAVNVRDGDRLATTQLRLGLVGPSARARQIQDAIHGLFGRTGFNGWAHQLRDEPLLQVGHERLWRGNLARAANGLQWDGSLHAGGVAGNLATHANAGGEIRFGRDLPDDMASSPFRLAGDGAAPALRATADSGWHLFASLDHRLVLRDITLDGNSWKDSHSVERRRHVADLTLGVVVRRGPWRFAATHTRRTREFKGQAEAPVFGTFSVSRRFR